MNLTVLMSVKNGEPYIREAVASILGQTYQDFRFLIIDNASTDNTREIIKGYKDPRITLVELPEDIGQTGALNKGLAMIETPYVARLDADDVALPERLALQMEYLETDPEVALLGGAVAWIDESGAPLDNVLNYPAEHRDIINNFCLGNQFAHSAVVYRLDAVRVAGGYDSSFIYAQDCALWIELARRFKVANLPLVLTKVRTHTGRMTHDLPSTLRRSEEVRLLEMVIDLPGLSYMPQTMALLWRAALIFRMGRKREGVRLALKQILRRPLGCLMNPYVFNMSWRIAKIRLGGRLA